jgi:hypothetical protein
MVEHDDSRTREIFRDVMREELPGAITKGVGEFMVALGVDTTDSKAKIAMQQDMAFLRRLRLQVGVLAMTAATGLVSGAIALWQTFFGGAAPPHHP